MERRLGKRLLFSDIQSKRGNQQDGLCIPAARILWDFNFLRQLAPGHLDGFSNRRYEEKCESFDLLATKFESGVIRFLGEKSLQHWSPFKTWIPLLSFYYTEQSTVNSNSFKIAKNTAFEAKG